MRLLVDESGLQFIYSDQLRFLHAVGTPTIERASHVEPTEDGRWKAEIIGGPTLGPFDTRDEALREEVKWLKDNRDL